VYSLGIYIGFALTNFSILLLEALGWRHTYVVIGITGMASGLISFFVIMEPPRGRFDPKKKVEPEKKPDPITRGDIMKEKGLNADEEMHEANLEEETVMPTGRTQDGNINSSAMKTEEPSSIVSS